MDATHGLAAILRDARKGRAPQDEVGGWWRLAFREGLLDHELTGLAVIALDKSLGR
jgi:hypothetical protein